MKWHRQIITYFLVTILVLLGTAALAFPRDSDGNTGQERGSGFSVSAAYIHQFDTDIGRSGKFRLDRALMRADWKKKMSETVTLGIGANYDYSDYSFTGTLNDQITNPWNKVHALNLSVSALLDPDTNWKLFVAPSVGVAAESGADWGDSMVYGGIVWSTYRFSPTLTLGLGAGVFSKPEEVSAFPLIIVDWKITDRLRMANPLQAGPTGPAGLELSYTFNDFTIATGGSYRSARFRLDDRCPVSKGAGEDRSFPLWARFSAKLGKAGTVGIYGGAMVGGKMTVEDSRGHEISAESYDASPFLAATISFRF
ncbi:MAG TPA: DUF6268 family outer membrane beta-barrel protein [Thermodesulfovibrionales bacterium]|nr:DUF6268 family outer membrane beta-barrel protein [Thermodesulfovibrionales bacterium]